MSGSELTNNGNVNIAKYVYNNNANDDTHNYLSTYTGISSAVARLGTTQKEGYEVLSYDLKFIIQDMTVRKLSNGTVCKMKCRSKKPGLTDIKVDCQDFTIDSVKVGNVYVDFTHTFVPPDATQSPVVEIFGATPQVDGTTHYTKITYDGVNSQPIPAVNSEYVQRMTEFNKSIGIKLPTSYKVDEIFMIEIEYSGNFKTPFNDYQNFSTIWSIGDTTSLGTNAYGQPIGTDSEIGNLRVPSSYQNTQLAPSVIPSMFYPESKDYLITGGENGIYTYQRASSFVTGVQNHLFPCNLDVANMAKFTTTIVVPETHMAFSSSRIISSKSVKIGTVASIEYKFMESVPIPISYYHFSIFPRNGAVGYETIGFNTYNYKEVSLTSGKKIQNTSVYPKIGYTPNIVYMIGYAYLGLTLYMAMAAAPAAFGGDASVSANLGMEFMADVPMYTALGAPVAPGSFAAIASPTNPNATAMAVAIINSMPTDLPRTKLHIEYIDHTQIKIINWFYENLGLEYPFDKTGSRCVQAPALGNELVGGSCYGDMVIAATVLPLSSMQTIFSTPGLTAFIETWTEQRLMIAHEVSHMYFGNNVGISDRTEIWLKEGIGVFFAWYIEVIVDIKGQYGAGSVFENRYHMENVGVYLQKLSAGQPSVFKNASYHTEGSASMFWTLIVGGGDGSADAPLGATPLNGATVAERLVHFFAGLKRYLHTYQHTSSSIDEFVEALALGSGSSFPLMKLWINEFLSSGRNGNYSKTLNTNLAGDAVDSNDVIISDPTLYEYTIIGTANILVPKFRIQNGTYFDGSNNVAQPVLGLSGISVPTVTNDPGLYVSTNITGTNSTWIDINDKYVSGSDNTITVNNLA